MRVLAIDIETYSSEDLTKTGVYKYVEAKDFEILLFAYAYDDEPVQIIDLANGEALPASVVGDLRNKKVLKAAFNANFEITCLRKHFILNTAEWECTMVKSTMSGLPMSLDGVAKALKLKQQKMAVGKALINYFSKPCKPTKANGFRTRNLPHHDPEKWELFKEYCKQDVETEREIRKRMSFFQIPDAEKELWELDQDINRRGVMVDLQMVGNAIRFDEAHKEALTEEATGLTGLENPNSSTQLKEWLSDQMAREVESLTKTAIPDLLESTDCPNVTRMLELRQEMSKTSTKKYQAMADAVCADSRVRGLLQFYGASRTGRWAGRLVQVQNLPQNHIPDLDLAREIVKSGDRDMMELVFGNVPDTLSQLVRTAFIAPKGSRFIVADFSAIEARVTAWLAGEKWRLDVFNSHGKIYEASAAQMFKVPIEEITKGSPLRQKGKIAELACGYGGGVGALKAMGADKMGLSDKELQETINSWRNANPAIVRLWTDINAAAIKVIGSPSQSENVRGCTLFRDRGLLGIKLPSGRQLSYARPRIGQNRFGGKSIIYEGINQTTRKWEQQETYGGKLVENIVQAIARDCLAVSMLRLNAAGYKIVMHVHDEAVLETPNDFGSLDEVCAIMGQPIEWAKGLPLRADGYETDYYKKD